MKDLEKMNNNELASLIKKANKQIEFNRTRLNTKAKAKGKRMMNLSKETFEIKGLIDYVSNEMGYDITLKNRQPKYTFVRFFISNYINNKYNKLPLLDIAILIGVSDHSTVIYGMSQHKIMSNQNIALYDIISDKVKKIIKHFNYINKIESLDAFFI